MDLAFRHHGSVPLPYGLARPMFVRTPGHAQAKSTGCVLEQSPHFPKTEPSQIPEKCDFNTRVASLATSSTRLLGMGRRPLSTDDRGVALDIEAIRPVLPRLSLDRLPYLLFSIRDAPNNALNKPGTPEANGLRVLAPEAATSMQVRLTPKFT